MDQNYFLAKVMICWNIQLGTLSIELSLDRLGVAVDRVGVLGERKEQVASWRGEKEDIGLHATTALQRP